MGVVSTCVLFSMDNAAGGVWAVASGNVAMVRTRRHVNRLVRVCMGRQRRLA
jgi:hypothetical protein